MKENNILIEWPDWSEIINESFIPLVDNTDRYLILYGGRGSSKSDFAAKKLIFRCLSEDYFKCVLIRNSYNSIKESSYEQIKQTIIDLGLEELFEFKLQPLEINCKINNNRFIARGCDDTTKLKSLKDFSCVWYEEDILSEEDFITITTSIRTEKADYLQEIFTINPEVEGNFQDHWFYKSFFGNNQDEKSFRISKLIDIGKSTHTQYCTIHHSTYRDNKWIPDSFIAYLMSMKTQNPYYYTIYCEGEWGNKVIGGLAYRTFVRAKNVTELQYDEDLALHISFDFNRKPYVSMTIWQIKDNIEIKCIDLIAGRYPDNTTMAVCREFKRRFTHHKAGLFIYGDPSGKNEDTRSEEGHNDYSVIEMELTNYNPDMRVASKHPAIIPRLNFINCLFDTGFKELTLTIDNKCIELINDLLFQKENADGTKMKEKVSKNGESYEKYGHMSDSMDYFICEAFRDEYEEHMEGPRVFVREVGESEYNRKWGY